MVSVQKPQENFHQKFVAAKTGYRTQDINNLPGNADADKVVIRFGGENSKAAQNNEGSSCLGSLLHSLQEGFKGILQAFGFFHNQENSSAPQPIRDASSPVTAQAETLPASDLSSTDTSTPQNGHKTPPAVAPQTGDSEKTHADRPVASPADSDEPTVPSQDKDVSENSPGHQPDSIVDITPVTPETTNKPAGDTAAKPVENPVETLKNTLEQLKNNCKALEEQLQVEWITESFLGREMKKPKLPDTALPEVSIALERLKTVTDPSNVVTEDLKQSLSTRVEQLKSALEQLRQIKDNTRELPKTLQQAQALVKEKRQATQNGSQKVEWMLAGLQLDGMKQEIEEIQLLADQLYSVTKRQETMLNGLPTQLTQLAQLIQQRRQLGGDSPVLERITQDQRQTPSQLSDFIYNLQQEVNTLGFPSSLEGKALLAELTRVAEAGKLADKTPEGVIRHALQANQVIGRGSGSIVLQIPGSDKYVLRVPQDIKNPAGTNSRITPDVDPVNHVVARLGHVKVMHFLPGVRAKSDEPSTQLIASMPQSAFDALIPKLNAAHHARKALDMYGNNVLIDAAQGQFHPFDFAADDTMNGSVQSNDLKQHNPLVNMLMALRFDSQQDPSLVRKIAGKIITANLHDLHDLDRKNVSLKLNYLGETLKQGGLDQQTDYILNEIQEIHAAKQRLPRRTDCPDLADLDQNPNLQRRIQAFQQYLDTHLLNTPDLSLEAQLSLQEQLKATDNQ